MYTLFVASLAFTYLMSQQIRYSTFFFPKQEDLQQISFIDDVLVSRELIKCLIICEMFSKTQNFDNATSPSFHSAFNDDSYIKQSIINILMLVNLMLHVQHADCQHTLRAKKLPSLRLPAQHQHCHRQSKDVSRAYLSCWKRQQFIICIIILIAIRLTRALYTLLTAAPFILFRVL